GSDRRGCRGATDRHGGGRHALRDPARAAPRRVRERRLTGVVCVVHAAEREAARLAYFGLFALQHRGQESAGIAVSEGGRVTAVRDMGLVPQVFDAAKLGAFPGKIAIGHTRYSTTGGARWSNAQPLVVHGAARTVALGHNGNLVDLGALREELLADGV